MHHHTSVHLRDFRVKALWVWDAPDLSTLMYLLCHIIKGLTSSVGTLVAPSLTCEEEVYQLPFAIVLSVHWQLILQPKISAQNVGQVHVCPRRTLPTDSHPDTNSLLRQMLRLFHEVCSCSQNFPGLPHNLVGFPIEVFN